MKKYLYAAPMALVLFIGACQDNEATDFQHEAKNLELTSILEATSLDGTGPEFYRLPASADYEGIPQDPNNPLTTEKVLLGRLLFHETALGIQPEMPVAIQSYSCASCHHAAGGFQAGRVQGLGDGAVGFGVNGEGRTLGPEYTSMHVDAQPIRTPAALNVAYQTNMLWNGQFGATGVNVGTEDQWMEGTPKAVNHLGFEGIETQAIAGLTVHRLGTNDNFIQNTSYKILFDAAFPDVVPSERYSLENAGLAIAAFERTLLASQSPFQKWIAGDSKAMTLDQKEGAILFFGKAGCADCHNGPALNDMDFHALGMKDLYQNMEFTTFKTNENNAEILGRASFTGKEEDKYKFKTPQLYNLKDSEFYGHGSSFRSIEAIIQYKNAAIHENPNVPASALSDKFQPLGLSETEVSLITDFIKNALYDPNLKRYQPNSLPSGFCTPNNDPVSRADVGCD